MKRWQGMQSRKEERKNEKTLNNKKDCITWASVRRRFFLLDSCNSPAMKISSRIKYALKRMRKSQSELIDLVLCYGCSLRSDCACSRTLETDGRPCES
jgi:hypothetical protein